ncbi:MAG: glycosyltransferase [Acidimicrobiia bacterium]
MLKRLRPSRWFWRINNNREARLILGLLERIGPIDLIHSHFSAAAGAIPHVSRVAGIPFVHTEHSSHLASPDPLRSTSRAGRAIMKQVFAAAKAVMLVGPDQLAAVRKLGLRGNITVVGNPVPSELFSAPKERARAGTRLISVGDLIPRKRQGLAIAAMAIVRRQMPVELHLVGSGPDEPKLRDLVSNLDLEAAVVFHGRLPRSEIAHLLAESDLYLHVSATESFGVAIVEALFSGVPVVTTRCGGVTSDLSTSVARLVDNEEPAEVARAVIESLDSDRFLKPTEIAAWAKERFGPEAVGQRIEANYRMALAGG